MVKVIGIDNEVKERVTCRKCASILEYVENDTKEKHGKDYGGGPAGQKWIVCPSCLENVILKSW